MHVQRANPLVRLSEKKDEEGQESEDQMGQHMQIKETDTVAIKVDDVDKSDTKEMHSQQYLVKEI